MSLNKKLNILLILTSLAFGLLFVIMILGYFFPGEPSPNQAPWFVWAAIGEMIAMIITTFTIGFIVQKKDKKAKAENDNEQNQAVGSRSPLSLSKRNNCIAVVKENGDGENTKKQQLSKVVCPEMQDRPLLREMSAQICKNEAEIYRCSFSAVGQNSTKTQINQRFL